MKTQFAAFATCFALTVLALVPQANAKSATSSWNKMSQDISRAGGACADLERTCSNSHWVKEFQFCNRNMRGADRLICKNIADRASDCVTNSLRFSARNLSDIGLAMSALDSMANSDDAMDLFQHAMQNASTCEEAIAELELIDNEIQKYYKSIK